MQKGTHKRYSILYNHSINYFMVCLERFEKCSILLFQTQDHIMLAHGADLFKSFQLGFDHENQPF